MKFVTDIMNRLSYTLLLYARQKPVDIHSEVGRITISPEMLT